MLNKLALKRKNRLRAAWLCALVNLSFISMSIQTHIMCVITDSKLDCMVQRQSAESHPQQNKEFVVDNKASNVDAAAKKVLIKPETWTPHREGRPRSRGELDQQTFVEHLVTISVCCCQISAPSLFTKVEQTTWKT